MDRKGKGKQIAGASSGKKRKGGGVEFRDEGLRINSKRKKPGVLQFFEESAEVGYYGESSDEDIDDFLNDMGDEPELETSGKDDKGGKGNSSFVFPKEEEMNEDDYDRMMEERYKPGSGFVRYAADDVKSSIEMDALVPTAHDPPIWKIKCAIGREKHSVFCLMHKFVELRKIGTKLRILSVFFVEHVKGFIFIEADKEQDVLEACLNLNGIYATRMILFPKSEAPHLLTVQRKTKTFSEGTWARIKSGKYKGDLAQVVAVSDTRGKALIKLIPRIDMAALAQKYGGGVAVQKGLNPAPRLINPSELEEFRPLIQVRRDRDTGMTFEHLDSLMLKDGFVYKKVSLDSLTSCGVKPSKEEILKFTPLEKKDTGDVEWISEIYGEEKEKKSIPTGKGREKGEGSGGEKGEGSGGGKGEGSGGGKGEGSGGGKGEGSSESQSESSYALYKLVCFSRKDFGLIVGVDDKGDGYKVLKEGSDGPVVVSVGKKEMQEEPFDSKFSALDLNKKQVSINDVVKISKGPSEGKQGVVRQVYRGIIFLYAEGEEENGGYLCCKSQSCEKVKLFTEESNDMTGGFDASAFGDSTSSPKSPLSPEKEWQPKEKYINSNQGDKGSMYSIGQKLRIRVGPLKGYLCRVIALRYSDITVKLDSQHKTFTVKSEHLAEVRDRNTVANTSGDAGMGSFQQFDMLGTEGNNGDWAKGAGTSEDNTSTWGNTASENKPDSAGDQSGGWNSWGKPPAPEASTVGVWGDASAPKGEASWGKPGASTSNVEDLGSWGKHGGSSDGNNKDDDSIWGKLVEESSQKKEESSWGKKSGSASDLGKGNGESTWGKKEGNSSASNKEGVSWGQQDKGSDGNQGGSSWGKNDVGSSTWGKKVDEVIKDGGSSWGKKVDDNTNDGSSWGKKVDDNTNDGSSWGKKVDDNTDDGSSWGKKVDANTNDGSSWGKKVDDNTDDGSSWGKKVDANNDGASSWGKKLGVKRMMVHQLGVKRLRMDLLGGTRMVDLLGPKKTMGDLRGVKRMMEGHQNKHLIGEDVGLVVEEVEVVEVVGISLGGEDHLVIRRITLHGVNQVEVVVVQPGVSKTVVEAVQAGVKTMTLVVEDLAGTSRIILVVVDLAGESKAVTREALAGGRKMMLVVVVVQAGVKRIMMAVVDLAGESKAVTVEVLAGGRKMILVVVVVQAGVKRIMMVVEDLAGGRKMMLVEDLTGHNRMVVVLLGVSRTTMVVVEDQAGPNKVMAVLNRGENRVVVVVGLVEEEEGDSEEVSAEVDQVEMEDARLNHLAGRETIKKTLLGRATRVVDQSGKNLGERIQTVQSHLILHQLVEIGVAGILIPRKKPLLVEAGVPTPRRKQVLVLVEAGVLTQRRKPMLVEAGVLTPRRKPMLVEAGVLTPRRKPMLVEAGVLTQRRKPLLVMVTNQAMKTKQQLGEPLKNRRIQETTMTVGEKSQVMMLIRVEKLIMHGEARQTQERRHQVAQRGEPETKNPDGNKKDLK